MKKSDKLMATKMAASMY